jgi:hypothetical protein
LVMMPQVHHIHRLVIDGKLPVHRLAAIHRES